jgi:hypothetical protein
LISMRSGLKLFSITKMPITATAHQMSWRLYARHNVKRMWHRVTTGIAAS